MNSPQQVTGYGWENCPHQVRKRVEDVLGSLRRVTDENLAGLYLHGSLAMGCYHPPKSDIDLLAVAKNPLSTREKQAIIDYLAASRDSNPPVEISVVTEDTARDFRCLTPFEFHYSNDWYDRWLRSEVNLDAPATDEDLTMHFLAVKKRGVRLYGEGIDTVFPEIPTEACVASIRNDLNWINERFESLPTSYIVLNPCRALAFLKEGSFLSKQEGGEWALVNLPDKYYGIIQYALTGYSGDVTGAVDRQNLREFFNYVSAISRSRLKSGINNETIKEHPDDS